jgi:hypothetical protein
MIAFSTKHALSSKINSISSARLDLPKTKKRNQMNDCVFIFFHILKITGDKVLNI